jgi:long-chain fatty acid transport protein
MTIRHRYALSLAALAIALLLSSPSAYATNGYFSHGYSIYESGMGGAGVAYPQDCLAAATNPAGMALIGNCELVGVTYFEPSRGTVISGSGAGANGNYNGNSYSSFYIPQMGYNRMLNDTMSLGIAVYGNGGMNTSYTTAIPLFGTTQAGVDLEQLIVAPTFAWKINPSNTVGISLNFAYQMFSAYGLQNFDNAGVSTSPGHVTNNGQDTATGWGVRIGWIGQITPAVALGATYQSQMAMSKFGKYQGLFANQGKFDIPANYAAGIAVHVNPKTVVVLDVERILYSGVPAVANPMSNLFGCPAFGGTNPSNCLGGSSGAGFGWQDITAWKFGVAYQWTPALTVRAGWDHTDNPITAANVLFNALAPGVVTDHASVGATWTISPFQELTVAYMHAFTNSLTGPIPAAFGGGTAAISLSEDSFGAVYRWTF